jgi:hypothetical protein
MNAPRFFFRLVLAIVFGVCVSGTAKGVDKALTKILSENGYRAVPLHLSKDRGFLLTARINGKTAMLAVSLASPLSALYRSANRSLAINERKSGHHLTSALGPSTEEYGLASNNSIELANIVMPATTFAVLERPMAPATQYREWAGLLGEAELYRLAAILDCANSRLYLRPAGRDSRVTDAVGKIFDAQGFVSVPLRINSAHHFEATSQINAYRSLITIEPVNQFTTISDRSAAAGQVPVTATSDSLIGIGGVMRARKTGRITKLSVGDFAIPNVPVSVADALFDVLGLDQLKRCSAVIDLGARRLYLRSHRLNASN